MIISITITTSDSSLITQYQVEEDEIVESIKALIESQYPHIKAEYVHLYYMGKELLNYNTLQSYSIKNNDIILLTVYSLQSLPNDPELFYKTIKYNKDLLGQLYNLNPTLANMIEHSNDSNSFYKSIKYNKDLLGQLYNLNPKLANMIEHTDKRKLYQDDDLLNIDTQKEIESSILQNNINIDLNNAIEYIPESFASVNMLYIRLYVNNIPITAFVDCGAQRTFISLQCAQKVNLHNKIDNRFKSVARGIGNQTSTTVGRIHLAMLKLVNDKNSLVIACSFDVIKDQPMEMLFGLDMLRKHQCVIDLKNNCLIIGDSKVSFLTEAEANDKAEKKNTEISGEHKTPINNNISEDNIEKLVKLGFTREKSIEALIQCNNNLEMAATFLNGF